MNKKLLIPTIEEIEQFIIDAGSDDIATFGGEYEGGIHSQQIPDEITQCISALLEAEEHISSFLEIGVAAGGTTYLFNHFFKPDLIVLIDDNKHHKAKLRVETLRGIPRKEIIGRSDSELAISEALEMAPYDIILIDGDHNYPGVKLDIFLYLPMLKPGGFLILHDSALPEWGVMRAVKELKTDPTVKFIGEYLSAKHPRSLGVAVFKKVK